MTLLDIKDDQGAALARKLGSRCLWPGDTDITDEDSVQRAIDATIKTFGQINGVVNCAGMGMAIKVRLRCVRHGRWLTLTTRRSITTARRILWTFLRRSFELT